MREIVTLQFGHFSNFIGTHYWNSQQALLNEYKPLRNNPMVPNFRPEIDTDTLFREARGGTELSEDEPSIFFPRLLVFDLKGSRGSLRKRGYRTDPYQAITPQFIQQQQDYSKWHSIEVQKTFETKKQTKFTKFVLSSHEETRDLVLDDDEEVVETKSMEPIPKKPKKDYSRVDIESDLEQNISVWSDYLQVDFHHNTICEPSQFQFAEDSVSALNTTDGSLSMDNPFDIYTTGKEVLYGARSCDQYDEFTSQLMYFVEECDSLDGFQIFSDTFNAWGMTCSDFCQLIKDEIGTKCPIITYGSSPYVPSFTSDSDRMKFIMNTCLSYADMYENSSLFIPNSAQQLDESFSSNEFLTETFSPKKMYHSSSILASAFDSVSLSYRLNGSSNFKQIEMHTFCHEMSPMGSLRIANINLAFPYGFNTGMSLYQSLKDCKPIHQNTDFIPLLSQIATGYDAHAPYAHSLLIRGLTPMNAPLYHHSYLKERDELRMKRHGGEELEKTKHLVGCNTHFDMIESYMNQTRSFNKHAFHVNQPFQVPYTFPNYLNANILTDKGLIRSAESESNDRVETCPVGSYLSNSRNFTEHIRELSEYFEQLCGGSNPLQPSGLSSSGGFHYKLSSDDMKEYKETLGRILDNYDES